jgi:hypothetical protein
LTPEAPGSEEPAPLSRATKLGVAGVLLAAIGFGLFCAFTVPPFRWPDEQAHAGYALTLARGSLPTIETPIPVPEGSAALSQRLDLDRRRRSSVWVANHPPGGYVLALPMVAFADRTGHGDLANLAVRLVNVLSAAASAALTFAIGRRLVDERAGLLAAAFFVSFPSASFLLSLGMTDGISLVVTLACLLASVRILVGAPSRADWRNLSAALVAAALTRLTALGVGVVLAAVTLLVVARRERRLPVREALVTGVPPIVYAAWFWVGNQARYGDVAASRYLLQRFGREGSGSLLGALASGVTWDAAGRRLFTFLVAEPLVGNEMLGAGEVAYRSIEVAVVIAAVAAAVLVLRERRSDVLPDGAPRLAFWPWLALVVTFLVSWVMMAKHVSGGGSPHVRYMIVALPIIGVVTAFAILRARVARPAGRFLPALLGVGALLGLLAVRVDQTTRFAKWMPLHTGAPADSALSVASGPAWARQAALAIGYAGTALMIAAVLVILVRPAVSRSAREGS